MTKIDLNLPAEKIFKKKMGSDFVSTENYGSLQVAAEYCGINLPLKPFNAIWQHGCFKPWFLDFPDLLVYHAPNAKNKKIFVARKDEEKVLRSSGYKNVQAIGLPFVYLEEVNVYRYPGTLLVLPIHSLAGKSPFETTHEMENYADFIKNIEHKFSHVSVCVHPGCIENGYWINQFEHFNIPWIAGAEAKDSNALLRMKMLFSRFEYVTTNGWGSHVAYALASGAKVSIAGVVPQYTPESLLSDTGWGGNEEAVKMFLSAECVAREREFLRNFFVSPDMGVKDQALGKWLIGFENKKCPKELKKLFGWTTFERFAYYFSIHAFKAVLRKLLPVSFKRLLRRILANKCL